MTPIPIEGLLIIGFADVLTPDALPRKVAPIFQQNDAGGILFPPFKLAEQYVIGGHWGNLDEVDRLVISGKVTVLRNSILPKPNFVLYVMDGAVNYGNSVKVAEGWASASALKIQQAESALFRGSFDEARHLAKYAFALDESRFDAVALQVVAARQSKNRKAVNALTRLGYSLVDRLLFDHTVNSLHRQVAPTNWEGQYGRPRSIELAAA